MDKAVQVFKTKMKRQSSIACWAQVYSRHFYRPQGSASSRLSFVPVRAGVFANPVQLFSKPGRNVGVTLVAGRAQIPLEQQIGQTHLKQRKQNLTMRLETFVLKRGHNKIHLLTKKIHPTILAKKVLCLVPLARFGLHRLNHGLRFAKGQ